jgi:HSP20 family protein
MLTRTLLPRDPFRTLGREMDRLIESMFAGTPRLLTPEVRTRWFSAPMNIWEDDENVFVETEVPGVKMEAIEILATGDELTIKGERQIEYPEDANVLRRERGWGSFERKTTLPTEIDVEKVQAVLRDGVLTITLPKVEQRRPRRVQVKALTGKS